ncbi:hypothetical protein [Enterobacter sp. 22466]|uniref:hypothetical protein n=1 Tax=Enterobacter sp. 22466 TaxID=3453924 RepID=UPI003F850855
MIGDKLHIPKELDNEQPGNTQADNTLTAKINNKDFTAVIIGGRYDEDPRKKQEEKKWIRRSWGRGPLLPTDTCSGLQSKSLRLAISAYFGSH